MRFASHYHLKNDDGDDDDSGTNDEGKIEIFPKVWFSVPITIIYL